MEGKRISQLTPDISPSTDDYIVTVDGSTTQNKRVELGSLPVSTAQQTALDGKMDKVTSTGFFRVYTVDGNGNQTVTRAGAGNIQYTIAQRGAGGIMSVGTPVNADHATTKDYVDALVPIYGSGFPNGVVSAPVGSIYIDRNITNGASSWIKKSGTGNTGWQVLEGDTGWRNITSLLINGWTAVQVRVRRCDNVVIYGFEALNATASTAIALMNTPPGFRPTGLGVVNDRQFLTTATNPAVVWRAVLNVTDFAVQGASTSLALLYGTVNSSTTEAWPSTLPGTPV